MPALAVLLPNPVDPDLADERKSRTTERSSTLLCRRSMDWKERSN
jgi:hypothetical protein